MINEDFKKAVAQRNMDDIRVFLRMRLTLDHNYASGLFAEHLVYCLSHGVLENELYQKYDGRALPQTQSEKDFAELVGHLSTNFAKERVKRIIEIGKALWPEEQIAEGRKEEKEKSIRQGSSEGQKRFEKQRPVHSESGRKVFEQKTKTGRRIVSVREITPKEADCTSSNMGDTYRERDSDKRSYNARDYVRHEGSEHRDHKWEDSSKSSGMSPALIATLIAAGVGMAVIIGLLFS